MSDVNLPKECLRLLKPRLPQMLATLHRFVTAESPSLEKAAADRCCSVIAEEWNRHGARVERIAQKHRGDLLRITQAPHKSRPSGQLLILGHFDTEARRSDAVFVVEPSFGPRGLLKTARKGVGEAELIVHGRASHAGLTPQEGINAIHELARQLARIEGWNDFRRGVTVNAGIVEGGTRTNVIPERARAVLDLRAMRISDMRGMERRLHALRPFHRGARLEITGGFDRPPLERKMSASLFARAKSFAKQMNLSLGECTVGGGSDGNFTAALGIPTLDGLGAVGDGAHSSQEHILINTMPARATLLAALLATA